MRAHREISMPKYSYLNRRSNTVGAFRSNANGTLTTEQIGYLHYSEIAAITDSGGRRDRAFSFTLKQYALLMVTIGVATSLFSSRAIDQIGGGLLALLVIGSIFSLRLYIDERKATEQLRDEIVKKLISNWSSEAIGSVEGDVNMDQLFSISVAGMSFRIDERYWRELRQQQMENRLEAVRVYYLKRWTPPLLLSFQPISIFAEHVSPDEGIEAAIGVGDDGEIVFGDSLPDSEIVEIQSRVIPTGDL
jgi:hypothetical protein